MRSRKPLSLSKTFNALSRHPARLFELKNNLRGIAGHYKIPDGLTAAAYEDLILLRMQAALQAREGEFWTVLKKIKSPALLQDSWDRLVSLNPVLNGVKMKRTRAIDLYTAHYGVTSGFNLDDINFFIERMHRKGYVDFGARAMPGHGERLRRIEAVAAVPFRWVPSPQTALKIENRLKRRGYFRTSGRR